MGNLDQNQVWRSMRGKIRGENPKKKKKYGKRKRDSKRKEILRGKAEGFFGFSIEKRHLLRVLEVANEAVKTPSFVSLVRSKKRVNEIARKCKNNIHFPVAMSDHEKVLRIYAKYISFIPLLKFRPPKKRKWDKFVGFLFSKHFQEFKVKNEKAVQQCQMFYEDFCEPLIQEYLLNSYQ